MSAGKKQQRSAGREDILDSVTFAAFDLDSRIFRTLWHSLVRTPDVALAAVQGDYTRYLSPVRVFIALFGFQFVVAALFGTPLTGTLEQFSAHLEPQEVETWLAMGRTADGAVPTARDVDPALESWGAIMMWPLVLVTSLPFLLLLKLYRPGIPLWSHLQFYLVPINASFLLMIAAIPLWLVGDAWFATGVIPGMLVYYICTGWLIARFYSRSAFGAAARLAGLLALLPVTLILTGVGTLVSAHLILQIKFDLSLIDLFLLDNR